MAFLYVAAWQDYKEGSVNLLLLMVSVAVSIVLAAVCAFMTGMDVSVSERSASVLAVLALMGGLALCKKMGGADVIIFTQITFLYGFVPFLIVFSLSSITSFTVAVAKHFNGVGKSAEKSTFAAFRMQEIRFIPHIALATQAVLLAEVICWF